MLGKSVCVGLHAEVTVNEEGNVKKLVFAILILLNLSFIAVGQIASGGPFSLEKSVAAGGGGNSAGGSFDVVGTIGQGAARDGLIGGPFEHPIGFWVADQLIPTAASVSVSGRVLTANGAGIRNAVVTLTDTAGIVRTTVSGSFGSYVFNQVEVGQVYVLMVQSKRFRFSNPSRVIAVDDQIADLDLMADAQ